MGLSAVDVGLQGMKVGLSLGWAGEGCPSEKDTFGGKLKVGDGSALWVFGAESSLSH